MPKYSNAEFAFIPYKDIERHVRSVIELVQRTDKNRDIFKNSIDPFSALFEQKLQKISQKEWMRLELVRQKQKTLQNELGNFHQKILGSFAGFENLETGKIIDLCSRKKKIIAEIKNKHNTTKGNHKVAIYDDLQKVLESPEYNGFTAYCVEIIPKNKKKYNIPFVPSDNKTKMKRPLNERIRLIDGVSFYDLASGEKNTLERMFNILPDVIDSILGVDGDGRVSDSSSQSLYNTVF